MDEKTKQFLDDQFRFIESTKQEKREATEDWCRAKLDKEQPIDAALAVDMVDVAIKHAQFDRERFRVKAVQSADGTKVEVYADTRFRLANGQLATNYQAINIEDLSCDVGCAEQLRMVVESMVEGLEHFITDSEVKPDGEPDGRED